jgi:hypothetical protein
MPSRNLQISLPEDAAAKAAARAEIDASTSNTTIAADMPRLENRQAFRDFTKAIYTYSAAPTSTLVGIALTGDSIGDLIPGELTKMLGQSVIRADIQGPSSVQSVLTRSLSGATYDGDAATVNQSVLDGTGGYADFTYLPDARHITLGNGGVLTWNVGAGGLQAYSQIRVYLAKAPGMGSAFVEVYNRDTSAVITSTTVSLSNASIAGAKAQFTGLTKGVKYGVRVTATGTVVVLKTLFLRDAGYVPLSLNRGNSTLTQNAYANSTLLTYLLNDLGVSLITVCAKEEGGQAEISTWLTRLAGHTTSSKLIIGSLPDGAGDAALIAKNEIWRTEALSRGFSWFNGFDVFGSYAELYRLGWIGIIDTTHPIEPANRYAAALLYAELPFARYLGLTIRDDINHLGDSARRVATNSFQVPRGDFTEGVIDVISNSGGGTPGLANLRNVNNVYFDSDGTTRAYLTGRDGTTVQVKNTSGSIGSFYAGIFEATRADEYAFQAASGGARFGTNLVYIGTAGTSGTRYGSNTGPIDTWGSGSPQGVVAAPVGSTYRRTDGGTGTSFYVKETGTTTSSGWVAK